MMCQNCGKNHASTFLKQNINGEIKEWHLCEECASSASAKDIYQVFSDMGFGLDSFWGNFFAEQAPQVGEGPEEPKCPSCNKTFSSIVKSGKVGCADCYSVFYDRLLPSIQRIHGKTRHVGKIPESAGEELKKEREIDALQKKLAEHIAKQDYEECARLRDRIKTLEEEIEQTNIEKEKTKEDGDLNEAN